MEKKTTCLKNLPERGEKIMSIKIRNIFLILFAMLFALIVFGNTVYGYDEIKIYMNDMDFATKKNYINVTDMSVNTSKTKESLKIEKIEDNKIKISPAQGYQEANIFMIDIEEYSEEPICVIIDGIVNINTKKRKYVSGIYSENSDLIIEVLKEGKLNINTDDGDGIYIKKNLKIINYGDIKIEADYGWGIFGKKSLTIESSGFILIKNNAGASMYCIGTNGDLNITLKEGKLSKEGMLILGEIRIPDGVYSNDKKTSGIYAEGNINLEGEGDVTIWADMNAIKSYNNLNIDFKGEITINGVGDRAGVIFGENGVKIILNRIYGLKRMLY